MTGSRRPADDGAGGSDDRLLTAEFLARLERLDLVAKRLLAGEPRGDWRTPRRGVGASFRDHSRYTQGEDLRFLDWNVYSRSGELVIKRFESEEQLSLTLLIDASGSMDFGARNKFLCAKRIAAALGFIGLNRSVTVSLATLGDATAPARSTFRGRGQVEPLLRTLDERSARGALDLFEAVSTVVGKRRGRGIAVLLSDFFVEDGYARALHFLKHSGYAVAVVHVLDTADLHPSLGGRLELVDVESGRSAVETLAPDTVDEYVGEVRAWCEGVERFCRSQDVAYSRVDTSWQLEDVIKTLLLSGGVLR